MPDESVQSTPQTDVLSMPGVMPPPQEQSMVSGSTALQAPPEAIVAPSGPGGTPQLPPRQPGEAAAAQPTNKAQFFREMLGNFFYAAGQGLSQAGHGPGSFGRGLGAGLTALPELHAQQRQQQIAAQQAQAQVEYNRARANALESGNQTIQVPVYGPDGKVVVGPDGNPQTQPILQKDLANYFSKTGTAGINAAGKNTVQETKNEGALGLQDKKNEGALDKQDAANSNAQLLTEKKIKSAEKIAQWKITGAKDVAQLKVFAAQAAREAKLDEPTAQAKNSAETARVVLGGIDRVTPMIDQLNAAGALGAFKGKVTQLQEGKIGMDALGLSPENARLAMNFIDSLKFINSGMLKTHFGARGGQQMYEKFTQMLNAGQDVNTMKGGLDAFKFYATKYAEEGKRVGGGPAAPKATGGKGNYSPDNPFAH